MAMRLRSPAGLLLAACLALLGGRAAAAEWGRPRLALETADGAHGLGFQLAAQFRWTYLYFEPTPDGERASRSRLLFRRLRPVLRGHLFGDRLHWLLHLNLVPGATELMDLWLDYRLHDWVQVRLGQMKIPYTRYRLNSFKDRIAADWSPATIAFGCERQLGVMLHNGVGDPPEYEFELGLFNGVNARASNGIGLEQTYAEPLPNPSDLADPDPLYDQMHAELVLHLAYNAGDYDRRRPSDLAGGSPRWSLGLSWAWDLQPRARRDLQMRFAPEVELRWAHWALGGQLYLGLFDPAHGGGGYAPGLLGGLVYTSHLFAERYELGLRYAIVHRLGDLRRDARREAEARLAAAPEAERPALQQRHALTGRVRSDHELVLAFNWYLFGTTLKWQTDAGLLLRELDDDSLLDARLRTQLLLAF